ncbi:MAG: DUF4105 domain-containing protein [Rickettsiales bacterium]|jgi:hypothetical protein|nr:DUF4105 domain-containing protein [Rickettsiales bacterium]
MKKILVVLFALFIPVAGHAARADRIDSLIAAAKEQNLASHPSWRALLHFTGGSSVITDPEFWLAEDGRKNPEAELEATIRGFYEPYFSPRMFEREFKNGYKSSFLKQHPTCAYPARLAFLETALGTSFPRVGCPNYEQWRARMLGDSASVVFASNTLGNPSSMFGHTFLRIDQDDNVFGSPTVNFAAVTPDTSNALVFAVQGFTGGYPGIWTVAPYYEKIKIYGIIDNRNLQEFRLNLSPEQVEFLKQHIWELSYVYADYYFMDVNCSSALVDLLRVANPLIKENRGVAVFPTEVMRAVEPMVEGGKLRLSMQARITSRWNELTPEEKAAVKNFKKIEDLDGLPDLRSRARVVEVLFDMNQYDLAHGNITEEEMREKSFELIYTRRALRGLGPVFDDAPELEPAFDTHRIMSAYMGAAADNFGGRALLGFSPAYHRFMDDDFGMNKWSEISALELEGSLGTEGVLFERFTFASLISMNPEVALFDGWSWSAGAGFWSFKDVKTWRRDGVAFGLDGGFGKSFVVSGDGDLVYLFATADLNSKFQSAGMKFGLAEYLSFGKDNLEIFANAATRRYGSAGFGNRFTVFINRNLQIDTGLKIEWFYELNKFGTGVSTRLTKHF